MQPAFYVPCVLQVPEILGSGAQIDEKTSVGDPLEGNREYIFLFPKSIFILYV